MAGWDPNPSSDIREGQTSPGPSTSRTIWGVGGPGARDRDPNWINPFALDSSSPLSKDLTEQTARLIRAIGSVNVVVTGQTGVGKSTLINAVFGEEFAQTASGRPVTQRAEWFSSPFVPLRILDTRGLEAKDYLITLRDMRHEIEQARAERDASEQMHMAWVCISAPSSRVQDCDVDAVRVLNKYDIPVVIVVTKYDDEPVFIDEVKAEMLARRAKFAAIVPLRALPRPMRPVSGLDNLVQSTFEALPAAHRAAFAAAQRVTRQINRSAADDFIAAATSSAAAAAVIPLPFADLATLGPIHAAMLVGISNAFGIPFDRRQVGQLLTTVLGMLAVALAGRWAVGTALKFVPGPGTVLGSLLNAGVAGALTRSVGKTYSNFLYAFMEEHARAPSSEEIFELFPDFFRAHRTGS